MKHRINKVKREHSLIDGAIKALSPLINDEEVTSILPGLITKSRTFTKTELTFQYNTETGEKWLIKGHGAVQEIFVIRQERNRE
ncbi:hypothetical protein AUK11_01295 [bacterium CG2_30_37_16]|nr:MAG: hypothetical protein AUK11_01295 [bacterium CG2_30_37_16]